MAVADVFGAEVLGIALAVDGVAVLEGFHQARVAAYDGREVGEQNHAHQAGHAVFVQVLPSLVAHEEQLGFGVVDDVVDVVGLELVQNGDDDCSIGDGGQEGDGPMGAVASADGNLVAGLDACTLQYDVELGYLPGHVFVL